MTTPTAPTLDSRVIALAHYAARSVLENVLARHGVTYHQSVMLRLAVLADGPVDRAHLAGGVVDSLKIDKADAHAVVEELVGGGLLTAESLLLTTTTTTMTPVTVTDAGRELYRTISAETAPVSARIYAGISAGDLAVAGRVLSLITERANAEPAALA